MNPSHKQNKLDNRLRRLRRQIEEAKAALPAAIALSSESATNLQRRIHALNRLIEERTSR